MNPANYSVIRFIPDLGRNEPLNVGIIVWDDRASMLKIDEAAITRVIKENPFIPKDTLIIGEEALRHQLALEGPNAVTKSSRLVETVGISWAFSEARYTTTSPTATQPLQETLDRLLARVVRLQRRAFAGGFMPANTLAREFKPWIDQNIIHRNHIFGSRSGRPRSVDFFSNSTANIALDALPLSVKDAKEIGQRADAEAFKIQDINRSDIRFLVYCHFSQEKSHTDANVAAQDVLKSVGATVITDISEAARAVSEAVAHKTETAAIAF